MRPAVFQRLRPLQRSGLAFSVCLAAFAGGLAPASALDVSSVQRAAGVWELSRDEGARKCAIQLRAEPASSGNAIGMPPGCRHAMPLVASVASWTLPSAGRLDFTDRKGAVILSFVARAGGLTAMGPGGEGYVLMTSSDVAQGATRPTPRAEVLAQASAQGSAQAGPPARAAEIPGRYSVLREGGAKDTGCMLTLHPGAKAHLAPACRDNGFVIFDPQSWAFANNRLRLTARKGHHATFERGADGIWQKDPKEGGKPIGFRKM